MPPIPTTEVNDSIAKVNNEVAVGEDLAFQRRWWRFENIAWIVFALLVVLDLLGLFGRGWLAKGHVRSADSTMDIQFERVERFGTPSILDVQLGPNAIHDGKVQLWVNYAAVKQLGAKRVIPQPASSVIGDDGILYTFAASIPPASVQFALEPSSPGIFPLELRVPGSPMITVKIVVMP